MKKTEILALLFMALIFAGSCVSQPPVFTRETLPSIDSSTATQPLMAKIIARLLKIPEETAAQEYPHTHTFEAYKKLIAGNVDLIFSMEPNTELIKLAAEKGVTFDVTPIGRDAFVFIVNHKNPINGLSLEQIRGIYSGKISNWKDLGGESEIILPYQREHESGSQAIMESVVMKGLTIIPPLAETIYTGMDTMNRTLTYDNAKNAIGYNIYYFTYYMEPHPEIKMLAINGVYPDKKTIRSQDYPLTGNICAIVRNDEPENSNTRQIITWLKTKEGQKMVEDGGYTPIY